MLYFSALLTAELFKRTVSTTCLLYLPSHSLPNLPLPDFCSYHSTGAAIMNTTSGLLIAQSNGKLYLSLLLLLSFCKHKFHENRHLTENTQNIMK
jgi:hypothetical protein